MSVGIYRNLSLGISFLPVTYYLVPREDWSSLLGVWHWILISAAIAVIVVWCEFEGLKRVPVGIFATLSTGIRIALFMVWGVLFFGEYLSVKQLIGITVLVLGMGWLGFNMKKKIFNHLLPSPWYVQVALLLTTSVFMSIAFVFLVKASRAANPLLVGHVWEFMIGVCSLMAIMIRGSFGYGKLEGIPLKTFGKILLAASPTIVGTGCYALASTQGPLAILGAIGTIGIGIQALVAVFYFHEKLNSSQWLGIAVSVVGILMLKLAS